MNLFDIANSGVRAGEDLRTIFNVIRQVFRRGLTDIVDLGARENQFHAEPIRRDGQEGAGGVEGVHLLLEYDPIGGYGRQGHQCRPEFEA